MRIGNDMIKYCIPFLIALAMVPAFAQTYNCPNGCSVTLTQNPTPAPSTTTNNLSYYQNPDPSTSLFTDIVNTFFNKLGQAATQMAGGGSYGTQVQNMTGSVQRVVDTGIDYVSALKYLIASFLGLIVPKLFGISVPAYILPAIEWSMVAIVIIMIWRKSWEIALTALVIGIIIIIVVFFGGVFIH